MDHILPVEYEAVPDDGSRPHPERRSEIRMPDAPEPLFAAPDGPAGARGKPGITPEVYEQLRHIAARYVAGQPPAPDLRATELVHDAYLRLASRDAASWVDERHFFASAAQAMRHLLVDRARRQRALRHGGGRFRIELRDEHVLAEDRAEHLLRLDEALDQLRGVDERMHSIVMLRYFVGMTLEQAADLLTVSLATAKRDWAFAKAWLHERLSSS